MMFRIWDLEFKKNKFVFIQNSTFLSNYEGVKMYKNTTAISHQYHLFLSQSLNAFRYLENRNNRKHNQ